MANDYLKLGDWNAVCDVCGFKFKATQLRKRWDNLMVCESDYELRNPQDYLRVPKDNPSPPWARPDPYTPLILCTYITAQGIAGVSVAGCARAGVINP